MPTCNATGQIILDQTDPEVRRRAIWLSRHRWPEDCDRLWHMQWLDFLAWIYQLHPREAMLLSNDKHFARFRDAKKEKGVFGRAISWVWRLIWE